METLQPCMQLEPILTWAGGEQSGWVENDSGEYLGVAEGGGLLAGDWFGQRLPHPGSDIVFDLKILKMQLLV